MMKELLVLLTILCFTTQEVPSAKSGDDDEDGIQEIPVDQGTNFTLPCGAVKLREGESVMWIHEGGKDLFSTRTILKNGSMFLQTVKKSDAGTYSCRRESDYPTSAGLEARVRIRVCTPPLAPDNVTVTPFTISASISWVVPKDGDGGHPIDYFQIAYRLKNETDKDWKTCIPTFINPQLRQYDIYELVQNSTYLIKVWASNKLGSGLSTTIETVTKNDPQEIELRKHFLDGVDSFDVRIWIIAVGIVGLTLTVLGVATCCLFYKEYSLKLSDSSDSDGESIELMPNIILNPGYDFQSMEITEPDENSNDTTALRINNNSVIFPSRV